MLLKYFYDQALAHASYLVGCQKTKEALIVDPGTMWSSISQPLAARGCPSLGSRKRTSTPTTFPGARIGGTPRCQVAPIRRGPSRMEVHVRLPV